MASEVKEENNSTSEDVKKDAAAEEVKKVDNEVKDKDGVKNEIKEESGKEASDDDDNEDDDEEEEVALLDRPVEVTGCRARKKVERLDVSFTVTKEKQEFPEGKGKKLGECPRIEAQIQKLKIPDLKPLHKILFSRTGSANEIKKNIRKFNGFPFEKDSSEYNKKKASVEKLTLSLIKQICQTLDIERSGTKEEIVNRIMAFLLNPEDSGKKVPVKKKATKEKKKSAGKKAKSEKKGKTGKNESEEEPGESVEEDDDSTGQEDSVGGTDEECEGFAGSDEEPKKKSKDTKASKAKPKAEKGKKEDKKTKATKRKQEKESSASSEDEPAAKKSKMPSDEDISKLVKQILESADLQEITMKKVIKQVSDAYPDFDLSHKKAFIKSTIKSVIS